jgi:hypothetical protein
MPDFPSAGLDLVQHLNLDGIILQQKVTVIGVIISHNFNGDARRSGRRMERTLHVCHTTISLRAIYEGVMSCQVMPGCHVMPGHARSCQGVMSCQVMPGCHVMPGHARVSCHARSCQVSTITPRNVFRWNSQLEGIGDTHSRHTGNTPYRCGMVLVKMTVRAAAAAAGGSPW